MKLNKQHFGKKYVDSFILERIAKYALPDVLGDGVFK